MKTSIPTKLFLIAAILLAALPAAPAAHGQRVSVRLLNISDVPFGTVHVAAHPSHQSPLLDPARPPGDPLRLLAEGSDALIEAEARDSAGSRAHVHAGTMPGPGPGETVTGEIPVTPYHRNLSLVAHLPGRGVAGMASRHIGRSLRSDVLAWAVGETLAVHPERNSPVARVWLTYRGPDRRGDRRYAAAAPQLTAAQRQEREQCLQAADHCVWRIERGAGVCIACIDPLRPNAQRTHCVE